MKKTIQKECLYILLAVSMSVISLIFLALFIDNSKSLAIPDQLPGFSWSFDYRSSLVDQPKTTIPASNLEEFVLFLGQAKKFEKMTIIYRGKIDKHTFRIDKIIHALDPNVSYPQDISIKDARSGFTLLGYHFTLLAAGNKSIRLIYDKSY
jgi:hypothetical protein